MRFILSICLFFLQLHSKGQAPTFQWATPFGSSGEEYAFAIAIDDSSNSYVTGYIDATNFIRSTGTTCINHDIFIAKYDPAGNQLWMTQLGGSTEDIGWGITVDNDHNVYVAASFMDTIVVNNDSMISKGYVDVLIAKFSNSGEFLWAKTAGGTGADYGYSITNDSQNNIYVTGSFFGTVQFGNTNVTSQGWNDYYLAKYDPNGNMLWLKTAGGPSAINDEGYSVTTDKDNNVFTCGKFGDTAYFGPDTIISEGNADCFIAKYDPSGILQWIKQAGGPETDIAQGISQDDEGSVYITGYFENMCILDSTTLSSNGDSDILIASYNQAGDLKWAKNAGGIGSDHGTAQFGTIAVTSNGGADMFLYCLDSAGNHEWLRNSGGIGNDAGSAVRVDSAERIFISGVFTSNCVFDSIAITSSGSKDYFVTMLSPNVAIGISESNTTEGLQVYPNPTTRILNIKSAESGFSDGYLNLFDSKGKLVRKTEFNRGEKTIDLNGIQPGIYLLQSVIDTKVFYNKIVIN
jgi:hypothetical protein